MPQLTMRTHSIGVDRVKNFKIRFKQYLPYYIMLLPGLLYLFINNYMPIGGVLVAFKDINFSEGIFASPWVGLKNFEFLFRNGDIWVITRNTILYNLAFLVLNNVIPLAIAIFLSLINSKKSLKFYQTVILIPHLISMVVVSFLVYGFLSSDMGFFNRSLLPALGIEPVSWYTNPVYWPFILPLVNVWKSAGYQSIVYLASVIAIDKEYYEAAELDGATFWQQLKKITMPMVKPTVIMLVLLQIGRIFYSDFGLFYQVTMDSGMIYSTTNVIDTYVFRALMTLGDYGMSSAAGLYQSVVGFILVIISNAVVKKWSSENALF